ncbi:uncharacterized protein LOC129569248 [Sitodiplosis mosellana]|uniref:uncharacterized protein LOC129569248 n=1 Tax=Sitodiplosis mosellana TaxID=263140 RepID=UPI0024452141|nr:uncharacterized protein LOC129569248 [Sitodiplosis mosellana]
MSDQLNQKRSLNTAISNSNQGSSEVRIPVTKSLIPGLISYFEEYGEIENVTVLVRFKDEKVAESVLQKRFHKIENRIWTTESPKESPEQPYTKKMKLVQSAHILDLSDGILLNIFKRLDLVDLAHAAETCVRMDNIAKSVFALKHIKYECHLNDETIAVLPRFGDLVKELEFFGDEDEQHFDAVLKYCKNMETLRMENMYLNTNKWHTMIVGLSKLKNVHLEDVGGFEFDDEANGLSMATNQSVEELSLIHCGFSSEVFALFVKMMPNLQELCIYEEKKLTERYMKQLGQLKALKRLEIECQDIAVQALLDGLWLNSVMLEEIAISPCSFDPETIDDIISTITKLKTIKVLELSCKFESVLEDKHLVRLAKGLPLLSKLKIRSTGMTIGGLKDVLRFAKRLTQMTLHTPYPYPDLALVAIGAADYQAILETVKRRSNKLNLLLCLPRKVDIDQIGADVRQRNSEWLEIRRSF